MGVDPDGSDEWEEIGFVISSNYRTAVLRHLAEDASTPTAIADRAGLPVTHVSRALRTLAERSLVELLVPKEIKKGRRYGLTDRGRLIWQHIETAGMID